MNPYGNMSSNIKYNSLGQGDYAIDEQEEVNSFIIIVILILVS